MIKHKNEPVLTDKENGINIFRTVVSKVYSYVGIPVYKMSSQHFQREFRKKQKNRRTRKKVLQTLSHTQTHTHKQEEKKAASLENP